MPTKTVSTRNKLSLQGLENLAEIVPGIIAVYNVHTGSYIYINNAVHKILGYTPKEIMDKGARFVSGLLHPDDVAAITQKNAAILAEANKRPPNTPDKEPIGQFEYRLKHKKGHYVWLRTDGSVYSRRADGTVDHVLNVSLDITEQKETEAALRKLSAELETRVEKATRKAEEEREQLVEQHRQIQKSEDRLDLALKASNMGLWEWDMQADELKWNDDLKHLFGLKASDTITYEKYLTLLHPDDAKPMRKVIQKAMKDGGAYAVQHRVIWPDGSVHWLLGHGRAVFENGKPVRMMGTTMSIDDRKKVERELSVSQKKFDTLFNSKTIAFYIPASDGAILEANDKYLQLVGYSRADLKAGKVRWDTMTAPEHLALDKYKHAQLDKYNVTTPWEKDYIRKDGTRVPVLISAVNMTEPPYYCLSIALDMTERNKIEARRQAAEAKASMLNAERAQLLALNRAKDEFISIASHQLRTPATGVRINIDMLLEGYYGELTPKQRDLLQQIYDTNERELRVINDLLKVANVDAGKVELLPEQQDVVVLLKELVAEQRPVLANNRQRLVLVAPRSLRASIDGRYLRMALENIVNNAHKYSPDGTEVTVSVKNAKDEYVITIKDQGVGISKKDQYKLFQKFSRIDNPLSNVFVGSGLGLYWSKKIIDLHSGSITLESKLNTGSTFTITLPKQYRKKHD